MALSKYNFEAGDNKFQVIESEDQPSNMFIVDNTSSTKCENLDILTNSQQAITKKCITKVLKRKNKLQLKENTMIKQSNCTAKLKNLHNIKFGMNITNHKHIPISTNKCTIVHKKKKISKHKDSKAKKSSEILKNNEYGSDFYQNFECRSASEQSNKDVKHFPNKSEHNIVSKKKNKCKHRVVENTELSASDIYNEDVPDNILFFYDLKGSNASKKLKTVCNVSSSVLLKRNLSEDTEGNITIKSTLQNNTKKLKSSKDNEKTISSDYLSKNIELNSNQSIESHLQLVSKNKDDKQANSVKEDSVFEANIAGKKRKGITSKDDSGDKCMFFKKLMLKKVNVEPFVEKVSKELKTKDSAVTVGDNLEMLSDKQISENVIDNFVENDVSESSLEYISSQNAHPNCDKDENFKGEKNVTCNAARIHDIVLDAVSNLIPFKDIENLPDDKDDNLNVQSPKKTNSTMKQKVYDELSIPEITTIKESSEKIVESFNSEFEKEHSLLKKSRVSLHLNDMIATSVSDLQCENKIKLSFKESEMTVKSIQVSDEESTFSPQFSNLNVVSGNEVVLTQNLNRENCSYIKDNCSLNTSDSVNLSSMTDEVLNKNQQISDQNTSSFVSSSNTLISVNACEDHINVIHDEDFNNSSKKKNSCCMVLKESAIKTDLESVNTKTYSEDDVQKTISSTSKNISHPIVLDSMKSDTEYIVENSSNVETELKSEIKKSSAENICSHVPLGDATLILEKDRNTLKSISSRDLSIKSVLCSNENNGATKKVDTKYTDQEYLKENTNFEAALEILNPDEEKEISAHVENNSLDSDTQLENIEKESEKKNAENLCKLNEEKIFPILLVNETHVYKSPLLKDSSKISVGEKCPTDIDECSNQLKDIDSKNNIVISKECTKSNLPIASFCVDDRNISINNAKIFIKEEENSLKVLNESEKAANIIEKLEKIIVDNAENILSSNESTYSDNMNNSINHVKILVKETNTFPLLSESEKLIDACVNSDQSNVFISQNNSTIDYENNKNSSNKKTLNESVSSDNIHNLVNDVKIVVKDILESLQFSSDLKNVEETLSDNKNFSLKEKTIEMNSPSLQSTELNLSKFEKSPEKMSKDCEKDSVCSLESQEQYIIIDESNSDADDSKSNYSEQSVENVKISPMKDIVDSNKSNFKRNTSFSNARNKHLCKNDNEQIKPVVKNSSKELLKNYSDKKNSNKSSIKAEAIAESDFKICISSNNDCYKNLYEENNHQIKQILDEVISEVLLGNCAKEIVNSKSHLNGTTLAIESKFGVDIPSNNNDYKYLSGKNSHQIEPVCKKSISDTSIENCSLEINNIISSKSSLSNFKTGLLVVANDIEYSLTDSNKILTSGVSVMEKDCSQYRTESLEKHEIECTEINNLIGKKNSLELSESIFLPSFSSEKKFESFSDISYKNKDKKMILESANSIPVKNFSSAASTELFSMYRNELIHDEEKADASLSSRDGILSNCQENEEIESQSCSSNHSDEDVDSRYSSQEEEENTMDKLIASEDFDIPSKNIDETILQKNNSHPNFKAGSDTYNDGNCLQDKNTKNASVTGNIDEACEEMSNIGILPTQSLMHKNKIESKNEENSADDASKLLESSKKELKLILTDCKSSLENDDLNLTVENKSSCSLTLDNNKNVCNQVSVTEKKLLKSKRGKSKQNSAGCNSSKKRYSLRHHKSDQSKDDSSNLGIDLNKLKFDSPTSRHTRSRRESKFVKLLTSNVKCQDNLNDVTLTKRETRSSVAKSDVETESNAPSYNLRNRKSIIAPPKFKI